MNLEIPAPTRLSGHWLCLARLAWLVITVLLLVLFGLSLRLAYAKMIAQPTGTLVGSSLSPTALRTGLTELGLSTRFYAGYLSTLLLLFVLAYTGVGALIFWRKADDPLAILISFWLMIFGITFPPPINDLVSQTTQPNWLTMALFLFINGIQNIGLAAFFLLFYLFPDGRFVPRWTRWPAVCFVGWIMLTVLFPNSWLDSNTWPPLLNILLTLGFGLSMGYAQLYRYRRISNPRQREQTKWVVFGLATALIGFILTGVIDPFFPARQQSGVVVLIYDLTLGTILILTFLCIPFSIGIAILRYHLYDIDIIIRRTLIYSVLTALLGLVYWGSVVMLQQLLRTFTNEGQNSFVIVISTLTIAALFTPLRHRVQAGIDRRFYRRKYDAERVLAAFSAICRDETDLDRLAVALTRVIHETMQPTQVSLWLRQPHSEVAAKWRATEQEPVG